MNQIMPFIMKYKVAIAIVVILALYYFLVYKKKDTKPKDETNPNKDAMEAEIARIIQNIRNTPDWIAAITESSTANGTDLSVELRKNAIYILKTTSGASAGGFDYTSYE